MLRRVTPHLAAALSRFLQERPVIGAGCRSRIAVLEEASGLGLAALPLPGSGHTIERWRALAVAAAYDLAFAKLYEGHTDALSTLQPLDTSLGDTGRTWGVWAAEAPGARVTWRRPGPERVVLEGTKAWCSGAAHVSHGLLTVWPAEGESSRPWLAVVAMRQPGVSFDAAPWAAVGMAASESIDVRFDHVPARLVGVADDYLARPGFWQGGAGIAACWHGGAAAMADDLRSAAATGDAWHRLLALGEVDVAMTANATLLREAAAWIDAHPDDDAQTWALRVRASTEAVVALVLDRVGRALGAAPFCRDARFAQRAADLPVFVRQSHGDRDLAALGAASASHAGAAPWVL